MMTVLCAIDEVGGGVEGGVDDETTAKTLKKAILKKKPNIDL